VSAPGDDGADRAVADPRLSSSGAGLAAGPVLSDDDRLRIGRYPAESLRSASGTVRWVFRRYGFAVASVALVAIAELSFDPDSSRLPFLLYLAPVFVNGAYGGLGPGLLALAMASATFDYFVLPPVGSFKVNGASHVILLGSFVGAGVLVLYVARRGHEALGWAQARLARGAPDLGASTRPSALQAERPMAAILEFIPTALWSIDGDWRFTYLNREAERLFGIREDVVRGMSVWTALPAFVGTALDRELHRAVAENRAVAFDLRMPPAGRCYRVRAHPAGGGLSVVLRDVTDRVQLEADRAMINAREDELGRQLRALTDSALGQKLSGLDSLEALLRVISDQARVLVGAHQALTTVVPDGDWRRAIQIVSLSEKYAAWRASEATGGEGIWRIVWDSNRPLRLTQAELEAHPRWQRFGPKGAAPVRGLLAVPLIGHDGHPLGVIQVADRVESEFTAVNEAMLVQLAYLTSAAVENVRLSRTAHEAHRLKDDFLAILSHELRTPLSAILGWARVLRTTQPDRGTTERALESIERNVLTQTKLIDDLLDISRILSGRLRLEVGPVELGLVITAAVETARPAAEAKGVRLEKALDPSAGPISGDPDRLRQIVSNLISNAVKFTPGGGSILVRLERRLTVAEVAVTDTGLGIVPERLAHVFEPSRQSDGGRGHSQGGLGFGLVVARHLTELQGGAIRAESVGIGRGATFTVSFPIAATGSPTTRTAREARIREGPPALPVLAGLTVLIVDDDDDTRDMLRFVLGQLGAEVRTAAGSGQALDHLAHGLPDVLVSDIGMPGEDGYSLICRIRNLPPERGGRVPAVALTAHVKPEDRMRALAAGFQTHVPKPVDPDELALAIARLAGLGRPTTQ
jgi:PAS domain S-box-containing protein